MIICRDIVSIRRYYRPIKCNDVAWRAQKMPNTKENQMPVRQAAGDRMQTFRYINIGTTTTNRSYPTSSINNNNNNNLSSISDAIGADDAKPHSRAHSKKKVWKCIRCPETRVFSPGKYQDGVVIELPPLVSCSGHRIPQNRYIIETFFSPPSNQISLSEGMHTFVGRIKNSATEEVEKVCNLKYKVMVKRCKKFLNADENLRIFCDAANVWGSKCKFSCRNNTKLSHNQPLYCDDSLQWSGQVPFCKTAAPSKSACLATTKTCSKASK